jgi:creatinine amidohydrolase
VGVLRLATMTWPEVRAAIDAGHDTVVAPFGATEQHGPHLPLGTDALFGDELGAAVAERLGACLAPTMPIGCSRHHLAFAGTLSMDEETFHRVVADVVQALARCFRRIVLLPTHGGNFRPLGDAVAKLPSLPGVDVIAFSDVMLLTEAALGVSAELGISAEEGGIHAGEWETSMLLSFRPDLVRMERATAGYVGELMPGLERFFAEGVHAVSDIGVFGDPRRASAAAGRRYVDRLVDMMVERIEAGVGG